MQQSRLSVLCFLMRRAWIPLENASPASSQRPLVPAQRGHPVEIPVLNLVLERGDDLFLPLQEMRPAQVAAGDGVVRDGGIRCSHGTFVWQSPQP